MKLTDAILKQIMPLAPQKTRQAALPLLNATALHYGITTERRMAMWLATLAVESGELRYQQELASGAAYEGRTDLGNTQQGDGRRFKGHGRIQITGRDAHAAYTNYLRKSGHLPFVDFVASPHRLAEEPYATDAAGWFVNGYKKLNPLADANNFLAYQVKVNGRNRKTGQPNHWQERQNYYARALRALPDGFVLTANDVQPVAFADIDRDALETEDGYPDFTPVDPEGNQTALEQADDGQPYPTPRPEAESGPEGLQTPAIGIPAAANTAPAEQILIKERPSTFTKWLVAIKVALGAAITGVTGWCGSSEIAQNAGQQAAQRALDNANATWVTPLVTGVAIIALGLVAGLVLLFVAAWLWDKSSERAQKLNTAKLLAAENPATPTTDFRLPYTATK